MPNFLAQVDLGTIDAPSGSIQVPDAGGDPTGLVASIIQNGITLLITVAFIIALVWMIFAGYSFIFAGDDPKKISSAWTRIYWGIIGLVIVLGSFAIIKLAETFFGVNILTGGIEIPTIR